MPGPLARLSIVGVLLAAATVAALQAHDPPPQGAAEGIRYVASHSTLLLWWDVAKDGIQFAPDPQGDRVPDDQVRPIDGDPPLPTPTQPPDEGNCLIVLCMSEDEKDDDKDDEPRKERRKHGRAHR